MALGPGCLVTKKLVKTNIDGSFTASSSQGCWGVVARNSEGQSLMMAAGNLQNLQDAISSRGNDLHPGSEDC